MAGLSLRQLELFAELPRHATLGSAAAALRISESALSQAITAVARTVGEQLCVRRKARGLQMTPAGQYFAERARRVAREAADLVHAVPRDDGELRGPVRLGCFASFATALVPSILEGFPALHPGVDVQVTVGTDEDLLPAVAAGHLDLALVYDLLLPPEFEKRVLYETKLEAVLPPEHPLAERPVVALEDLAAEPLIMYDSPPSVVTTNRAFREAGLEPRIRTSLPQVILVQALVARGLGYSLLMSRPHNPAMSPEGRPLVWRPLRVDAGRTAVVGVWPREMELTARARAVLDYAVEVSARARPDADLL